jgi:hypothetical protein
MMPRLPLPPELAMAPFTVAAATAQGLGPSRLRGFDLEKPFWGVRATLGSTDSLLRLAVAYDQWMPTSSFYSHVTAARLWGIRLPTRLQNAGTLDVAVRGSTLPEGKRIRGHRLQVDPIDVVAGANGGSALRLTSLARTWCDLGALLTEEELVAAGDFVLWRKRPDSVRLSGPDLTAALDRFAGRRGRPRLIRSIPLLSDRSDSHPESVLRWQFAAAGLPRPEVNPEIRTASGELIAQPDLSYKKYKLAFDYEGDHHRTDEVQWGKDIARVPRLRQNGWAHRRASKADLHDSRGLISNLAGMLRERGWDGRTLD